MFRPTVAVALPLALAGALIVAPSPALPAAGDQGQAAARSQPAVGGPLRPDKPDDGRDGGVLRSGALKVQHELPPELALIARDLHDDRQMIAGAALWLLVLASVLVGLLGLATLRYVVSGWRRS